MLSVLKLPRSYWRLLVRLEPRLLEAKGDRSARLASVYGSVEQAQREPLIHELCARGATLCACLHRTPPLLTRERMLPQGLALWRCMTPLHDDDWELLLPLDPHTWRARLSFPSDPATLLVWHFYPSRDSVVAAFGSFVLRLESVPRPPRAHWPHCYPWRRVT